LVRLVLALFLVVVGLGGCGGTVEEGEVGEAPTAVAEAVETGAASVVTEEAEAPADTVEAEAPAEDPLGTVEVGPGEPIRIAAMFVLSGANESLGRDSRDGVEIAVEDAAEILGHPIDLQVEDSECTPEGGQTAMTKVAADPQILGVIGPNCSSAVKAALPIATQAGLVAISPSATGPDLTSADRPADYGAFFRTAVNDQLQAEIGATFAYQELGKRKLATIHDGSTYAEQLQALYADKFAELGGEVVAQEAVSDGDVDMKPVLTRIAAAQPDIVFYPIFTDEGGFITSQARDVAGLEEVALMGADGLFSSDFVEAAGPAAVGVYLSGPHTVGEAYDAFLATLEEKYGRGPLSGYHAHAYDATRILLDGIARVAVEGPDGSLLIGRQALRDALYDTRDYQGLTGVLTCQEEEYPGDCATGSALAVYRIEQAQVDGEWPPEPIFQP
jgi:branched-chain amino acid transport system substrate-binding protein